MTLQERYAEARAAWHTARSQMLSDRLTLSRKEAQMHEADVEQDDSVADYFANRRAEMARRVAADEERLAALAANAEEIRIAMVMEELDATIASYEAALRALESRLAELQEQATQAASLTRRATELAETLPVSAMKQREDAARLAARTETIQAAVQYLEAAISEPGT